LLAAMSGDFKMADIHMERAIAKNPLNSFTLQNQGYSLLWRGDAMGAIEIGMLLRRLDPLVDHGDHAWVSNLLIYAYYMAGDYEASLDSLRRCMPLAWWGDYVYLTACLGQLGRLDEARASWQQLLQFKPGFTAAKYLRVSGMRKPEDIERLRDGLRKGGITQ